jgi:hypothetical protein
MRVVFEYSISRRQSKFCYFPGNRDDSKVNLGIIHLKNACPILLINMAISLLLPTILEEHSDCQNDSDINT